MLGHPAFRALDIRFVLAFRAHAGGAKVRLPNSAKNDLGRKAIVMLNLIKRKSERKPARNEPHRAAAASHAFAFAQAECWSALPPRKPRPRYQRRRDMGRHRLCSAKSTL